MGLIPAVAEVVTVTRIDTDKISIYPSAGCWDFSDASIIDGTQRSVFAVLGDSLVVERYPDLRLTFAPADGALALRAEENRNMRTVIDDSCGICLYASPAPCREDSYTASGRYARRWDTSQAGTFSTQTSAPGTLVMCDGDSIRGVLCQSLTRRFTSEADSTGATRDTEITYIRWIRTDDPVPYAFMAESRMLDKDGIVAASSCSAYLRLRDAGEARAHEDYADASDIYQLLDHDTAMAWLSESALAVDGRTVSVSLAPSIGYGLSEDLPVTLAITDESGILYASSTGVSADAMVSIDCSSLLPGHYLAVISAPDSVSMTIIKRMVVLM